MKAVILAGGKGTRISEESTFKPKPMIEIGGKPILWHIMKTYSNSGINDFVLCLGYKGYMIKEYFANYYLHSSDVKIDIKNNSIDIHENNSEPWTITLIDTGEDTMTGGRVKRIQKYVDDTFCLTYGDGLSDLKISDTIDFHRSINATTTLTAVQPPGRFGVLDLDGNKIKNFYEKPQGDQGWVNGGYFVMEPEIFDYLENDQTILERSPLENLALNNKLYAYKHTGFWQPMDTLRDKIKLEEMWSSGKAAWKTW